MRKIIGTCLFIFGVIILLNSSYSLIYIMTTSKEEMIEQQKIELSKYEPKIPDEEIQYLAENSVIDNKIIPIILVLIWIGIGIGIAFGGIRIYKKRNNFIPLDKNSEFLQLIKKQNQILIITLIGTIALFLITLFFSIAYENPIVIILLLICISGIIYLVREIIFFNYNFKDANNHLVGWDYPNGDKLIITGWGLMKYNKINPKLSTSAKFEGFRWDFDNAKDLAENLLKNEGNPLITLLPSIHFTTKTNKVDDYIPFSFVDKINLTFVDKDNGHLVISIEKRNYNSKYSLTYPLPPQKKSLVSEFEILEKRINNKQTPVRVVYLDKSYVEEILNRN